MRFLFFVFGVPMMILSFFQVSDALPYVESTNLYMNGQEVSLSQNQQEDLKMQLDKLFEGSHTMPALAVVFGNDFQESLKEGSFVSLKFGQEVQINDLPFDELFFKVSPDAYGFNLFRGNHGVVQGRCIYVDLNGKTMQEFSDYVSTLIGESDPSQPEIQPPYFEKPSI